MIAPLIFCPIFFLLFANFFYFFIFLFFIFIECLCLHFFDFFSIFINFFFITQESDDDEVLRKTTLREVKILRMLRHPNIVSLTEAFRRKG